MRRWLISKLGGFTDTDAFIERVRELPLQDKNKILTVAVKRMFNTASADDILHQTETGEWLLQGRPMQREEMTALKQEADHFLKSRLFKVIDLDLQYHSNKLITLKSETLDDMRAGKLWKYTWDAVKTRLKDL